MPVASERPSSLRAVGLNGTESPESGRRRLRGLPAGPGARATGMPQAQAARASLSGSEPLW